MISTLYLDKIKLTQFKNYTSETLSFSPQLNCFVGKNGMGKTNLLDAIYYLCMCKSSTGLNDRNVVQRDTDFFRLEGDFKKEGKKAKIVAKVIPGKKKTFERNKVPYDRLMEHIGFLPVVMIIPDDTELAKEGSEVRRKFLDNTLSQSDNLYLEQLLRYNRVLRQRNAALKQFAQARSFDKALISAFGTQLVVPANYIKNMRAQFIKAFAPIFEQYYTEISGAQEKVRLEYKTQLEESDFSTLLKNAEEKDRILQRTTVGIHKDDLVFYIDNFPLKKFASQGQLKSFVLAMKLAQYDYLKAIKKQQPLLLLDDIFDKLDRSRVEHLVRLLIEGDFGQVFITDTHELRIEEIIAHHSTNYKKYIIENGTSKTAGT
jgi:DNA replication and repair protein RecF